MKIDTKAYEENPFPKGTQAWMDWIDEKVMDEGISRRKVLRESSKDNGMIGYSFWYECGVMRLTR